jgi:hypothetical protein
LAIRSAENECNSVGRPRSPLRAADRRARLQGVLEFTSWNGDLTIDLPLNNEIDPRPPMIDLKCLRVVGDDGKPLATTLLWGVMLCPREGWDVNACGSYRFAGVDPATGMTLFSLEVDPSTSYRFVPLFFPEVWACEIDPNAFHYAFGWELAHPVTYVAQRPRTTCGP